jgi:hypothetical protein
MSVAMVLLRMFLRKLKNRSGSTSIQIISKQRGKSKVVKTIGSSDNEQQIQKLVFLGRQEIERLNDRSKLFISENDTLIEQVFETLGNASIRTVVPEIIFGKIYDSIGFNQIKKKLCCSVCSLKLILCAIIIFAFLICIPQVALLWFN